MCVVSLVYRHSSLQYTYRYNYFIAHRTPLKWILHSPSVVPHATIVALEMASALYGQEGQLLPLLAIKLSRVITIDDVSVLKVNQ